METYYGRPALKPAPFNKYVVGGYVFLAGLSGKAQVLGTLLDFTRGEEAAPVVRRARALSLLAPLVGGPLLIWDLHTPKRFYNMFRVFKRTSPMSVGTWILTAFSGFSFLSLIPGLGRVAQVPAAVAGAGLGTYTAGLFSSTSSPAWATAPRALSVRFAASSVASAAAALSLFATRRDVRQDLEAVCAGALAVELAATVAAEAEHRRVGLDRALDGPDGVIDRVGAVGLGVLLPLGLFGLALLTGGRSRALTGVASCAVLAGSLTMRVTTIGLGQESSRRPDISLGVVSVTGPDARIRQSL
jgi:formate-dependent nitrite reductase membrane component NrfD